MNKTLLTYLVFTSAYSVHAGVVTNTTCTYDPPSGAPISVSNPTACASQPLAGLPTSLQATANVSYSLTLPTAASNVFYSKISALALGNYPGDSFSRQISGSNFSNATISVDLTFYTLGPVQTGSVEYFSQLDSLAAESNSGLSSAKVNLAIGNLSGACQGTPVSASCTGAFRSNAQTTNNIYPFTLGQTFISHEDVSVAGVSAVAENTSFGFELLDANGNVVPLYLAPEPGSLGLLACGVAISLFGLGRKRRA